MSLSRLQPFKFSEVRLVNCASADISLSWLQPLRSSEIRLINCASADISLSWLQPARPSLVRLVSPASADISLSWLQSIRFSEVRLVKYCMPSSDGNRVKDSSDLFSTALEGCVRTQNTESHPMVLGLSADLRCQAIIRVCKASNRWRNSSRWCSNDTDWLMVVRNRKN
jgi:hypothetical protein